MRKPKLGFLSVTCPTHREAKTETGDDWVNYENIEKIKKGLQDKGLELVVYEKVVGSFYELDAAEKLFFDEDIDAVFIYITTWNWADQVSQFIRNFARPVIIYALVDSKAWSIGGLAATKGGLDELGIKNRIAYGDIRDEYVISRIVSYSKAAMVKNILRRSRYGSIGGQGMGILTGIVDANQWLKDFGILTGFTDQYSLVVEAGKISDKDVKSCYEELNKDYRSIPEYNSVFDNSIRLYLALEKIIEKERYNFTGVKCTFDLSDNYCSACLAQSRLGNRGFITACLNDSNGALSAYILSLLKSPEEPVFTADVNLAVKEKNLIKLIDDGAASPRLTLNPKKEAELLIQPTLEAKASGICTRLFAKPGRVNLIRLARIDGKYVLHLTEGDVIKVEEEEKQSILEECGYPIWPHALIKVKGDMDKFVENLRSEYIHMTYGDLVDGIKDFCEIFNIRLLEN
jgi:L-fucose isomerase-like protein